MFSLDMELDVDGKKNQAASNHLIRSIDGYVKNFNNASIEKLTEEVLQTFEDIISNFPVKTGKTVKSIKFSDYGDGHLEIYTNNEVVLFIEFGTQGHGPKTKPFLTFQIDGKWIRVKWVRGIDAHYIIMAALMRLDGRIKNFEENLVVEGD